MIDVEAVVPVLTKLYSDISQDITKARLICNTVCMELSERLKDESYSSNQEVIYACAAVTLYRYCLNRNLSDDTYQSVRAGDITVKCSPSQMLDSAEKFRDTALLAAYKYFKDVDFAFKVV